MSSDGVRDATPCEVTPGAGKGALGTWRALAGPGLGAGLTVAIKDGPSPACKPPVERGACESALKLPRCREDSRRTSQGQNHIREIRPCGIVGGPAETWTMVELGTRRTTERVRDGNSLPKVARAAVLSRRVRTVQRQEAYNRIRFTRHEDIFVSSNGIHQ